MSVGARRRFGPPGHSRTLFYGLISTLVMAAVLVFAIPQQWQNPASEFVHNGATYPLPVVFLVTQGTFLLSLLLLLIPNIKHESFGIGTALLTATLFLIPCDLINALLTVFMVFSTKKWEVAFFLLSWLLIPAHIVVVLGSWRLLLRLEVNRSFFVAGLVFVIIYASAAIGSWSTLDHRLRAQRDVAVKEARIAHDSVKAISWCAIQYKVEHSQVGYPPSLDAMNSTASCALHWALSSTPTYHVWYVPEKNVVGQTLHFSVRASRESDPPPDFNIRGLDDYVSDDSGIVYVLDRTAGSLKSIGDINDGDFNVGIDLHNLLNCVENFARAKRFANDRITEDGDYPANLAEMSQCEYIRSASTVQGNTIRERSYSITYRPAEKRHQQIEHFQIDARCENYGQTCIRNLFTDERGKIHGTGENRAATGQDPLSPNCEFTSEWCR